MQNFLPCCGSSFHFLNRILWSTFWRFDGVQVICFISYFCLCLCWHIWEHIVLLQVSRFMLMLSPERFPFLALLGRSLINFELIFVYSARQGSNFALSHVGIQLPQHCLLISLFSPPPIALVPSPLNARVNLHPQHCLAHLYVLLYGSTTLSSSRTSIVSWYLLWVLQLCCFFVWLYSSLPLALFSFFLIDD